MLQFKFNLKKQCQNDYFLRNYTNMLIKYYEWKLLEVLENITQCWTDTLEQCVIIWPFLGFVPFHFNVLCLKYSKRYPELKFYLLPCIYQFTF